MLRTLRNRFTLIFVGLSVIPLIAVASLIGIRVYTDLIANSLQSQRDLAKRFELAIQQTISTGIKDLNLLDRVYGFSQLSIEKQRDLFASLISNEGTFEKISIFDPKGEEQLEVSRYGSSIGSVDEDVDDKVELIQTLMTVNEMRVSNVYFDEQSGEPLLTVGIPFFDLRSGAVNLFVVADLRFRVIWELIAELQQDAQAGEGFSLFMTDSKGLVVAHSNSSVVLRNTQFTLPSGDGEYTSLDGEPAITVVRPIAIGNAQFVIVLQKHVADALLPVYQTVNGLVLITVATLAVAVILVVLIVRQVVSPIEKLSLVAQTVRKGDLSARSDIKRHDEIGQLATSFNEMTEAVQKREADLREQTAQRELLIKDLQAAKRLAEENSRLKSEFLSTMSHELRTPMNAIEGFTSIMLSRMGGVEFNEKTERYITRVNVNSKRLLQLINDFLDLSRVESGRLELAYQPFSPTDLAKRWQAEIGILAEKKNIGFEVNFDAHLPEVVYGDEEAISKIAINLLGNAIKFTEQGMVSLSLANGGDNWRIMVADTGIGIPPHAREYVFEEFRQVDQTSKRKYGGTGLGLAIVQKYARTMGGIVTLQSEVGVGSTFTVTLPIEAKLKPVEN